MWIQKYFTPKIEVSRSSHADPLKRQNYITQEITINVAQDLFSLPLYEGYDTKAQPEQ